MAATIKTTAVRDSRIDVVTADPIHIVEEGPANSTYQQIPTPNATSTTTTTYMITPPSPNVGLCRYLCQKVQGVITLSGTGIAANPPQVALRAWPLASITSSLQVQINNSNIAYAQHNSWMKAYAMVANPYSTQQTYQSGTSTAPDIFNSYLDMGNDVQSSPFLPAVSSTPGDANAQSRMLCITSITSTGADNLTVGFTITEPIICGPFVADTDETSALFGVNQVNITINWAPSLYKILSFIPGTAAVTNVAVTFTKQNLLINYVTPSETSLVNRPIAAHYSCPDIRLYSNTFGDTIDPGSTTTSSTQTITLPRCPRLAILWATPPNSVINDNYKSTISGTDYFAPGLPDMFLPISGVSVNAYDKASLLAGAQPEQLYAMSLSAGLKASLSQFLGRSVYGAVTAGEDLGTAVANYAGAPMVIDFSNLSLPKGIAPGSDAQTQFQINFTVANNLNATINTANPLPVVGYQVNMLIVTDGVLTLAGGASEWRLGGLTAAAVEEAALATPFQSLSVNKARSNSTIVGGSFWDSLKSVARMALPMVGMIQPELAPIAAAASGMLGAGASKPRKAGYY